MKPTLNPFHHLLNRHSRLLSITAAACCTWAAPAVHAEDLIWLTDESGDFNDSSKYDGEAAPAPSGDSVAANGAFTINYLTGFTHNLDILSLNGASGAGTFNQSGGSLTVGHLYFGRTASNAGGASRTPTYNLTGGTLNATAFTWGNGANGLGSQFIVNGGTINTAAQSLGTVGGAKASIIIDSGIFNAAGNVLVGSNGGIGNITLNDGNLTSNGSFSLGHSSNSTGTLNMTGGQADITTTFFRIGSASGATASASLSGDAILNIFSTGTTYMTNNGATSSLTIDDEAEFNLTGSPLVIGQFGSDSAPGSATVTVNAGTLSAPELVLGGLNASSPVAATVTLNGGIVATGGIRKGASSNNTLTIDGGTVRATAASANFFLNLPPTLGDNGLFFDTNTNDVTIANAMTGTGGLTKTGEGMLTLTALNTYTGDTVVSAGTIALQTTYLSDASTVTVNAGGILNMIHGGQDQVAKVVLDGVEHTTNGIYGPPASGATVESPLLQGTGFLRIGPAAPAKDLIWTGGFDAVWRTGGPDNFVEGVTPASFSFSDNVTFDDSSTQNVLDFEGLLYPGVVTFAGTQDYTLQDTSGEPAGLGGDASIIVNSTGTISLGGKSSSFTGPITVNSGRLIALNNFAFGASSGIEIASGAQVDLNSRPVAEEPALSNNYTYTLNGPGPDGGAAIINSGQPVFSASGVRNLILEADSVVGNDGSRFDIGSGGTISGNGHTLTKIGANEMGARGDSTGSIIHWVINGGMVFAQSQNPFGAAGSSVTVNTGAAVSHFGAATTYDVPLTINGGILRSGTFATGSNNTGTWTGDLSVSGNVTFDSVGGPLEVKGTITGVANVTKTGENATTIDNPTYTGNTTVASGTLVLKVPSLADSSIVTIAANAKLRLEYPVNGQEDTVDRLIIGGQVMIPGTYGASGSGADFEDDLYFEDANGVNGVLRVITGPQTFADWIAGFNVGGLTGANDDFDNDGLDNLVEHILGSNPTQFSQGLTQVSATGNTFVYRHEQTNDLASDVTKSYEWSSDLAEWNAGGDTNSGGTTATIAEATITNNAIPANDVIEVTVTIIEGPADKVFVRLVVSKDP